MGYSIGKLPAIYLGLPLCSKVPDSLWIIFTNKFHKKMGRWKGALLSQARKVYLLKVTLQNHQVYALILFKIPSKLAKEIERIHNKFLWFGVEERKRVPPVACDSI